MNKENVLELASFIEGQPMPFDMSAIYIPDCNTAGCIGGFAAVLWKDTALRACTRTPGTFDLGKIADKLDLTLDKAVELCYPPKLTQINRARAVAALRNLAETGEVVFREVDNW